METVTIESLHNAAKDVNQVLGLKPQIDVSWTQQRIEDSLRAVGDLIEASDELQKETWEVLGNLGFLKSGVITELKAKYPEAHFVIEAERVSESTEGTVESIVPEINTIAAALAATPSPEKDAASVEPTSNKVAATSKPERTTTAKVGSARGKREYAGLVERLIAEGTHTQKEIVNFVLREYPSLKADSVRTFVSDSKNPKYTTFSHSVILDEQGRMKFAD